MSHPKGKGGAEIPYPPVFRDWRLALGVDRRVATTAAAGGPMIEMFLGEHVRGGAVWRGVELTEDDACLLAASLLARSGREKLAAKVLQALGTGPLDRTVAPAVRRPQDSCSANPNGDSIA
jgi:hypothetical protein